MRRILLVLTVALVMAAMMLTMALPAFAAPNPESAAGEACGPPGQTHKEYAKILGASTPEVFFAEFFGEGGPPGKIGVTQFCAPGQLK